MIIDQLPSIGTVQSTDEIPIERGTTTYKTTVTDVGTTAASVIAATAAPLMDGTAAVGTSTKLARQDHVHPHDSLITNENLLDNWYLVGTGDAYGTFPINQRGQSSYSGSAGYTIDRWKTNYAADTVTLSDAGILIVTGGTHASTDFILTQLMYDTKVVLGAPYTISILVSGIQGSWAFTAGSRSSYSTGYRIQTNSITTTGLFTKTGTFTEDFSDFSVMIRLSEGASGNRIRIKAVKFELGDTQTLARWDGSNWVLNEIPDYGEQLRRCEKYFYRLKSDTAYGIYSLALATSATNARGVIQLPTTMVSPSSVTVSTSGVLNLAKADLSGASDITGISFQVKNKDFLTLTFTVASGLTAGNTYFFRNGNSTSPYIDFSCES